MLTRTEEVLVFHDLLICCAPEEGLTFLEKAQRLVLVFKLYGCSQSDTGEMCKNFKEILLFYNLKV